MKPQRDTAFIRVGSYNLNLDTLSKLGTIPKSLGGGGCFAQGPIGRCHALFVTKIRTDWNCDFGQKNEGAKNGDLRIDLLFFFCPTLFLPTWKSGAPSVGALHCLSLFFTPYIGIGCDPLFYIFRCPEVLYFGLDWIVWF